MVDSPRRQPGPFPRPARAAPIGGGIIPGSDFRRATASRGARGGATVSAPLVWSSRTPTSGFNRPPVPAASGPAGCVGHRGAGSLERRRHPADHPDPAVRHRGPRRLHPVRRAGYHHEGQRKLLRAGRGSRPRSGFDLELRRTLAYPWFVAAACGSWVTVWTVVRDAASPAWRPWSART